MILGITTDWHLRDRHPVNRIDDYYDKQFYKIEQIVKIFKDNNCRYIIHGGDVFDSHRISFKLLIDTIQFFQKHNLKIYGVIGNHCVTGYNLETINNSALGILMKLGFYNDINELNCIDELNVKGIHTRLNYDKSDYCNADIVVCHDMIIPQEDAPFDHIYWKELDGINNVKCIVSGHYHKPHILHGEKTLFVNPGAIMRMSIADDFIPGVDILDTQNYNVKRIELNVDNYEDVFRRNEEKDDKSVDIGTVHLEKVDKGNIVERVMKYAKDNGYDDSVIENVSKRIKKAKEEIG